MILGRKKISGRKSFQSKVIGILRVGEGGSMCVCGRAWVCKYANSIQIIVQGCPNLSKSTLSISTVLSTVLGRRRAGFSYETYLLISSKFLDTLKSQTLLFRLLEYVVYTTFIFFARSREPWYHFDLWRRNSPVAKCV